MTKDPSPISYAKTPQEEELLLQIIQQCRNEWLADQKRKNHTGYIATPGYIGHGIINRYMEVHYEHMPLLINHENPYVKAIALWRLRVGR